MIRKEITKHKTIQTKSPKEFDDLLEALLAEVALNDPSVSRFYDGEIGHCAYVEWKVEVIKPENLKDEFKLKGIEYVCGECPFFRLHPDRRVKYTTCQMGVRCSYEDGACERLYEGIQKGEIDMEVEA